LKHIAPAVFQLIEAASKGTFPPGNYFGQVGLAPYHQFDRRVTSAMRKRLADIETGLNKGSIVP
jgi:basic membrane protein A